MRFHRLVTTAVILSLAASLPALPAAAKKKKKQEPQGVLGPAMKRLTRELGGKDLRLRVDVTPVGRNGMDGTVAGPGGVRQRAQDKKLAYEKLGRARMAGFSEGRDGNLRLHLWQEGARRRFDTRNQNSTGHQGAMGAIDSQHRFERRDERQSSPWTTSGGTRQDVQMTVVADTEEELRQALAHVFYLDGAKPTETDVQECLARRPDETEKQAKRRCGLR